MGASRGDSPSPAPGGGSSSPVACAAAAAELVPVTEQLSFDKGAPQPPATAPATAPALFLQHLLVLSAHPCPSPSGFFLCFRQLQLLRDAAPPGRVVVVALAGPSGAGKSVFAAKLCELLPGSALLCMDMARGQSGRSSPCLPPSSALPVPAL